MKQLLFTYTAIRNMFEEPVELFEPKEEIPAELGALRSKDGLVFPAQVVGDGVIAILTAKKGEILELYAEDEVRFSLVNVAENAEEMSLKVTVGSSDFCEYHYSPKTIKPYLGPITDGDGHPFTRLQFDVWEHPHQRSVFIGVGDVNGIDFWNEPANSGMVVNKGIEDIVSGPAMGCFTANNLWQTRDGKPVVSESTTYTVYNQTAACRYIDVKIKFTANFGDVSFGATKEAGPLGVRVRDELREDKGAGHIRNSYGAEGENECWSKTAHWCDYYADVTNSDGVAEKMGVTVFDNEKNERYPTAWHVRAYGLFAANNLYFKGGLNIKAGESLEYRFRISFRTTDMTSREISDRFMLYISSNK